MAGALIVTAEFGRQDFAWLDGLRRRHFPPERNQLAAHLTIFHAFPPSAEPELRSRLSKLASGQAPKASISGVMDLGGGVAFRIATDDLAAIREDLASGLHGLLSAQDAHGWAPHVTIQNKVTNRLAQELKAQLARDFEPRPLAITGLGLHRYLDGPWETLAIYKFRGVS